MREPFPRISRQQFFFIFAIANICLTPFGFPTLLYKELEQHAWISPLAAYVLTIWNLLVAISLARQFPDQNIVEWSRQILGKWIGGLFSICVIVILYFWGVSMIWAFMLLIMFTQLAHTPIYFTSLLLIGGVVYLLMQGLEGFARFAELVFLFLIAGFIAINAVQFTNADFNRLLPVGGFPLDNLIKPDVIASLFVFRGIFIVYFLFKYLNDKKRLLPLSIYSLSIAFVEILLATVLPIAIYGAQAASKFIYPYQESLSSVSIEWLPFEKLTFLTPMLWQIVIVYVLGSSLFCATEGLSSLFNIKNKKRLLIIIGVVTWLIVMYQVSYMQLSQMIMVWSIAGLLIFTLIPTLLWAGLSIRRLLKS
ncbi:MAG: endospore germination permease [Paenibacillaceae bacterium]